MLRRNLPEFRGPSRRYNCPNPGTHVEDEATLASSCVSGIASLQSRKFSPGGAGIHRLHFGRMPPELQPALGTIERKSLLYRSGLGFHCINHVQGCSHGCRYPCHAFMLFNRHGRVRDYADWCQPRLVTNALQLLDRELARKRKLPNCVHLCLSTDPFMVRYPDVQAMSLSIVERLNVAGIACSILTKGILPADLADPTRFPVENTYGISLVSLDEGFRHQWEPGASRYA